MEVARAFTHEWVFKYDAPDNVLADNGGCFTSKFFQHVFHKLNIENWSTTTYHSPTKRQVEWYNHTIKFAIKAYL